MTALSGAARSIFAGARCPDNGQRRTVASYPALDERFTVGRKGDRVGVLLMALEHGRRAAAERPADRGRVEASGKCDRTVLGYRQRTPRPAMPGQIISRFSKYGDRFEDTVSIHLTF
jgi:hypothetical protein